jgi:hypothetical protein
VIEAARGSGLAVLPGMEVQTREEVHVLCLFDTLEQVADWQRTVDAALPNLPNREDHFGAQYVVDATGGHLHTDERLLSTSTSLTVEEVAAGVGALGGLCIPAHIDRPSYSILSNLGFVPEELPVVALEISTRAIGHAKIGTGRLVTDEKSTSGLENGRFSSIFEDSDRVSEMDQPGEERLTSPWKSVQYQAGSARYGVLVSSDAHRLSEMGAYTRLRIAAPTVAELQLALLGQCGRRTWLRSEPK